MEILKLTKDTNTLLIKNTALFYTIAVSNNWNVEVVEVDEATILNDYSEIN